MLRELIAVEDPNKYYKNVNRVFEFLVSVK